MARKKDDHRISWLHNFQFNELVQQMKTDYEPNLTTQLKHSPYPYLKNKIKFEIHLFQIYPQPSLENLSLGKWFVYKTQVNNKPYLKNFATSYSIWHPGKPTLHFPTIGNFVHSNTYNTPRPTYN